MQKSVQWMTLTELGDELDRTRPVWEAVDLDGVPARDQLPVLGHEAPVTRWSSLGPAGCAYSDSYLNDSWILVR